MASNFQFTGAPKIAKYNPKGLDFFLAAPKLKAEVKGAAMLANERSRTSMVGLHGQDLAGAQAMTSHINSSREDMMNSLLSNEPVTDASVSQIVKNFNQKKEVDQKLAKGLQNAQRIEKRNQQIDDMILRGGDPIYFNKIRAKGLSEWGGTWGPEGQGAGKDFVPASGPKYVNYKEELTKRLDNAKKDMTLSERANADFSDLEMIQQVTAAGTQLAYKQKANFDIYNNHPALKAVMDDFFKDVNDPTTELGAFGEFMGPDYAANQEKLLEGYETDFHLEDQRNPSETLKMGKFIPTGSGGIGGGKYVRSQPKSTQSAEIKFKPRNLVITPTMSDAGPSKDYSSYNTQASTMYTNIANIKDPTVGQLQAIMGTSTKEGAALINAKDVGPIGAWIAGIPKGGTSSGYIPQYNALQKDLKELSDLQGGNSSILFGSEVAINEDGTGEILNQEIYDLKLRINENYANLQHGWVNKTNTNKLSYYENPLTVANTENNTERDISKTYFDKINNTIGNRLLVKVKVNNDGSYDYMSTSAYGSSEERNKLQDEFSQNLNSFGDKKDAKGKGGGFIKKPLQTSLDGRDVFGEDLYAGGKLGDAGGVDGELSDALIFEKIVDGEKFHYIVGNQGTISTPVNSTAVQYGVGDDGPLEENPVPINTLMAGLPNGEVINVPSSRGDVRIQRTNVGWTMWGHKGRQLFKSHFAVSEALYQEQLK